MSTAAGVGRCAPGCRVTGHPRGRAGRRPVAVASRPGARGTPGPGPGTAPAAGAADGAGEGDGKSPAAGPAGGPATGTAGGPGWGPEPGPPGGRRRPGGPSLSSAAAGPRPPTRRRPVRRSGRAGRSPRPRTRRCGRPDPWEASIARSHPARGGPDEPARQGPAGDRIRPQFRRKRPIRPGVPPTSPPTRRPGRPSIRRFGQQRGRRVKSAGRRVVPVRSGVRASQDRSRARRTAQARSATVAPEPPPPLASGPARRPGVRRAFVATAAARALAPAGSHDGVPARQTPWRARPLAMPPRVTASSTAAPATADRCRSPERHPSRTGRRCGGADRPLAPDLQRQAIRAVLDGWPSPGSFG